MDMAHCRIELTPASQLYGPVPAHFPQVEGEMTEAASRHNELSSAVCVMH